MAEAAVELLPNPEGKATVLILGGSGFIGRHLVKYLVDNQLATFIRVADKAIPATAYLNAEHKAAFAQKNIVEFKQADLSKPDHVAKTFAEHKFNGGKFDYVVNLCGETRFGLSEADYKLKCFETASKCSEAAKAAGVSKWIEVSTAQVYEASGKNAATEESKLKPWTVQAGFRLKAEQTVTEQGLPAVILRPAVVWGPGDLTGLTPRLTCAAVYKKSGEKMQFLWDKGLKANMVHVSDVVRAIWTACTTLKPGSVYNLVGDDSNQGTLAELLAHVFGIKVGFMGTLLSSAAKLSMSAAAAHSNDKHVPPWTKFCQEMKIMNTPLSPYIDKELLYDNNLFVNGDKITQDSDFKYNTKLSQENVKAIVTSFIDQGLFPNVFAS